MPQATPPEEYRHTPLSSRSSIRLLRIHPQLKDRRLSCILEHFDSDDDTCPEYVALSYVWGDATKRHPIYINGLLRLIHTNLWLFLRRAWLNGAEPWFWTDALSLNQQSHAELNVQVARMGDIYANAVHVISWLGEDERGVDALEVMTQHMARQSSRVFIDSWATVSVLDMRTPAAQRLDRAWTQLVRREGSEYWRRAWVLLEVACAKASSVVYGPVAVDFEELLQIEELESLYQFWSTGTSEGPFCVAAEWIGKLYALRKQIKAGGTIGFVDLLEYLSGASSSRLADRVYGLVGLCSRLDPDFDPERLEIDYDKDLETIAWDAILLTMEITPLTLWSEFHLTMTRIFRSLGTFDRIAPPRNHHNFANTSHRRRGQTRRICQIHDAVVAAGYPWAAEGSTEWSVDSVVSATAALEQVLSHVCTSGTCLKQKKDKESTPDVDAVIGLSLIISQMEHLDLRKDTTETDYEEETPSHSTTDEETSSSDATSEETTSKETTPTKLTRLCEAHLPPHLRKTVHLRRSVHRRSSKQTARVHQLQPVTLASLDSSHWSWTTPLPRCAASTPSAPCDDAIVYLEIPELHLILRTQRDTSEIGTTRESWGSSSTGRSAGARTPVYVQWFCTACPLLWGAREERSDGSISLASIARPEEEEEEEEAELMPTLMEDSTMMPTIPERSHLRAPGAEFGSLPVVGTEDSRNRFLSSADFPWGRRPSLMDAWKEHRSKGSRTSNGPIAE